MKNFTLVLIALFTTLTLSASVVSEPTKTNPAKPTDEKELVIDNAVVTDAMKEFKSLSRVDRKMRLSQAKAALKEYKEQKKAYKKALKEDPTAPAPEPSTNTVLLVILAILLPPLAVGLHEGRLNGKFWLSLLLTLLFFLPGVIYALIVVLGDK